MDVERTDEREEFSALYREHYGAVLRYCRRRTDEETARDAAAETFLVAWRRREVVPQDPLPWLYGVARRVLANAARGAGRQRRTRPRGILVGLVPVDPHRQRPGAVGRRPHRS